MTISSIDELLLGGGNESLPENKEEELYQKEPESIEESDYEDNEINDEDNHQDSPDEHHEDDEDEIKKPSSKMDEYGNEKEPDNKNIRERLKQQARKYESEIDELRQQLAVRGASQEVQKAAKDFEYNPESSEDWQQQLAHFVKQTVTSMGAEQEEARTRQEEQHYQQEFESKFNAGVKKFDDFREVIGALTFTIDNPMTLATRSMDNPAAFLYAAAKRHPQELERISKMRDPYAKMAEMGKLDERMRKNKPTTQAPRPMGRISEDSVMKTEKKQKELNGDDLLAQADAKRLANARTRTKNHR